MANTSPANKTTTTKATPAKSKAPSPALGIEPNPNARIAELLNQLRTEKLPAKKRAIRRQLRALGHNGGLSNTNT